MASFQANNHHSIILFMGNQQPTAQTLFQADPVPTLTPAVAPLVPVHPHCKEHSTLEAIEQVSVEPVGPLPQPHEKAIITHSPPERAADNNTKIVPLPSLLHHVKKNRSLKLIEEIRNDKQNLADVLTHHTASSEADPPKPQVKTRQDAQIQVSDLRESDGVNAVEVKEFRVKKMRVSKNSLHCPGAYF